MPHDNTVSIAHEAKGPLRRGYMARIVELQNLGAPFVGLLHSNGYMVRRTDRFCPYKWFKVTYRLKYREDLRYVNKSEKDLAKFRQDPDVRIIRLDEIEPPKTAWIPAVSPKWMRAYTTEIKRLQRGGFGKPLLLETVESDGQNTTYMTYGGY